MKLSFTKRYFFYLCIWQAFLWKHQDKLYFSNSKGVDEKTKIRVTFSIDLPRDYDSLRSRGSLLFCFEEEAGELVLLGLDHGGKSKGGFHRSLGFQITEKISWISRLDASISTLLRRYFVPPFAYSEIFLVLICLFVKKSTGFLLKLTYLWNADWSCCDVKLEDLNL